MDAAIAPEVPPSACAGSSTAMTRAATPQPVRRPRRRLPLLPPRGAALRRLRRHRRRRRLRRPRRARLLHRDRRAAAAAGGRRLAVIGRHKEKAVYLLFSPAAQGVAREAAGNVLTPDALAALPAPGDGFKGHRVIYAEGCTVSPKGSAPRPWPSSRSPTRSTPPDWPRRFELKEYQQAALDRLPATCG